MGDKGLGELCPHCGYVEGTPPPNAQYLAPRTMLAGKYLIGRGLGHGGFGITYIAYDTVLKRRLAIKEYLPQDCATRASGQRQVTPFSAEEKAEQFHYGVDKFLEEARTLAQFDGHPNIVKVRDFFKENNTAYLVMNYLSGETLKDYLRRHDRALTFQQAINIILPVIDALRTVHAAGVLHRDVSPDNIFLTSNGHVELIDFGAARQPMGNQRSISVILKPGYAPEEQYRSRGKQGPWTDVYATGATLYRAVTGKVPPESLDRMERETLVPPSRLGVQIPPVTEEALLKAMAVRAQDRFQTMQEFKDALLQNDRPTLTRPKPGAAGAAGAAVAGREIIKEAQGSRQSAERRPVDRRSDRREQNGMPRRSAERAPASYTGDARRANAQRQANPRSDAQRAGRRQERPKHSGLRIGLLVATLIILLVVGGVLFGLYMLGEWYDNSGTTPPGGATQTGLLDSSTPLPATDGAFASATPASPEDTSGDAVTETVSPGDSATPEPTATPANLLPGAVSTRAATVYVPTAGTLYTIDDNGKQTRLLAGKMNYGLVGVAALNSFDQVEGIVNHYYPNAEGGVNYAPYAEPDSALQITFPPSLAVGVAWTEKAGAGASTIVAVDYTTTLNGKETTGCMIVENSGKYYVYAPGVGLHTIRADLVEDRGATYRVIDAVETNLDLLALTTAANTPQG